MLSRVQNQIVTKTERFFFTQIISNQLKIGICSVLFELRQNSTDELN